MHVDKGTSPLRVIMITGRELFMPLRLPQELHSMHARHLTALLSKLSRKSLAYLAVFTILLDCYRAYSILVWLVTLCLPAFALSLLFVRRDE